MSNWINTQLDVLALSPDEIEAIEKALVNPSEELIRWRARWAGAEPEHIANDVKEIVSFKPVCNLGFLHASVNEARRFESSWKDRFWGLVWSHVHLVSRNFSKAVFLAQYWDDQMSYGGKMVFYAGDQIRSSHDGDHHAQAREWVLPNIFAPFETEYELGLKCGSLWREWVQGMQDALAGLAECYNGTTELGFPAIDGDGKRKEEEA